MSDRRVVITGIGCLSPLGNNLEQTWAGMKEGRAGIGPITQIDTEAYDCKIAGEVKDFEPGGYFRAPKDARRADRFIQFAVAASKMAIDHAGLEVDKLDPTRIGTMVGSGIGGLATLEREHSVCMERGPGRVSPFVIPMMISNMATWVSWVKVI